MFTNHRMEDWIYPLKEIAKHKTKINRSIVQHAKTPTKELHFQLLKTQQCYIKMKLNHLSISTRQGDWDCITATFSTLTTQVSKRQQYKWSTKKAMLIPPSNNKSCSSCQDKRTSREILLYYQCCSWWLAKEHYLYTSWGNTFLKAKTKEIIISCASPWLIQQ